MATSTLHCVVSRAPSCGMEETDWGCEEEEDNKTVITTGSCVTLVHSNVSNSKIAMENNALNKDIAAVKSWLGQFEPSALNALMAPGPERFVQFVRIYFPNLPENFDDRITQLAQAFVAQAAQAPQAILVGRQDDSDQDTSSLGVLSAGAAARGGNAVVVAPAPQAIIEQGQGDGGQYGGTLGSADREQLMQGSVMTGVAGSRSGDETAGVASLVRAIWAAGASDVPSVQDLEPLHDPQEGTTAVSLQGSGQGNVEDETTSRPVVSQEEGEKEDEEEEKKPRAKKPRID